MDDRQGVENAEVSRLYVEALGIVLAHELIRLLGADRRPPAHERGGLARWQRRLVTEYIEEHMGSNLRLENLAEVAELSPFHFCGAFKKSFGMPPHQYHIDRRMRRARELLLHPRYPVTEVALELGSSTSGAFATAFRKEVGQAPSGYRRNA